MPECIIRKTTICPHDEISGKICSACKLPDVDRLKTEWYNYLLKKMPGFKKLGMDEQGKLVQCIVDYIAKNENPELIIALYDSIEAKDYVPDCGPDKYEEA